MKSRLLAVSVIIVTTGALASAMTTAAVGAKSPGKVGAIGVSVTPVSSRVISYGYDIKQPGRAQGLYKGKLPSAQANALFGGQRFATLRIPFYANKAQSAKLYRPIYRAANAAHKVDGALQVFANLKLEIGSTPQFLPSLSKGNFAKHYAALITDYLTIMAKHGVTVNQLGVLCETSQQRLTRAAHVANTAAAFYKEYDAIVSHVLADIHAAKSPALAVPTLVGPDSYSPSGAFVKGARSAIQIPSTHYYSKIRTQQHKGLRNLARVSGGVANLWDTEFHWNNLAPSANPYPTAREGMFAIFDNLDAGINGITWWAFNLCASGACTNNLQGSLQTQFVDYTRGTTKLATPTGAGSLVGDGHLVARAYRVGQEVRVWIVNDRGQIKNQKLALSGGTAISTSASCAQWTHTAAAPNTYARNMVGCSVNKNRNALHVAALPRHSFTVVTFQVG